MFSIPADRELAALYRSILMENDSGVLEPRRDVKGRLRSRHVTLNNLIKLIRRIRVEKHVPVDAIKSTLEWLSTTWNYPYMPEIVIHTDLYNKWENIQRAQLRERNGNNKCGHKTQQMLESGRTAINEMEMTQ